MLAVLTSRGEHVVEESALVTSPSRLHEREEDLQAGSDKLSKHLFETQIRLIVTGPPDAADAARQKLSEMAGTIGLFSSPRLAVFSVFRQTHSATLPRTDPREEGNRISPVSGWYCGPNFQP